MKEVFHRDQGRVVFLVIIAALGLIRPGPGLSQESENDKLKRGDILIALHPNSLSELSEVTGIILFDAPAALVWKVVTNYEGYSRFLPNIAQSKVERQEGPLVWQRVEVRNLWPYPTFRYLLKIAHRPETGEIEWRMEEGNLKSLSGRWKLEPFTGNPNQTKAAYTLFQDPGGFFLNFTQNLSNRSLVLELLDAFYAEIQLEKKRQEGQPDKVIRPNWRKAIFWWEELEPPRSRPGNPRPAPHPQPK